MNLNFVIYRTICLLLLAVTVLCERDYYDILGVSKKSSNRDIKKAFRKLAMQYHPDKNKDPGAEDKFKEIAQAYEILSDPEKRKKYDQFGKSAFEHGGAQHHSNFDFNDFFSHFDSFHSQGFGKRNSHSGFKFSFGQNNFFDFEDLFSDFEPEEEGFGGFHDMHQFGKMDSFFGSHFDFPQNMQKEMFQQQSFSSSNGGRCKTVTQRVGNTVTTYTQCS